MPPCNLKKGSIKHESVLNVLLAFFMILLLYLRYFYVREYVCTMIIYDGDAHMALKFLITWWHDPNIRTLLLNPLNTSILLPNKIRKVFLS